MDQFQSVFGDFGDYLYNELIKDPTSVPVRTEKEVITEEIFNRYDEMPLVDAYEAFQMLSNLYSQIAFDLEIIATEGFDAIRGIDKNMVTKKKDDKTIEVQDGWKGRILPFALVQQKFFADDVEEIGHIETALLEITSKFEEILETFSEEDMDSAIVNEEHDGFVNKEVPGAVLDILSDISSPEIDAIKNYIELLASGAKRGDKIDFISNCSLVDWNAIEQSKDGTYTSKNAQKYLSSLQMAYEFDEDTFEGKVLRISKLITEEKELKKRLKDKVAELEERTIDFIKTITDDDAKAILEIKWVHPLTMQIVSAPTKLLDAYSDRIAKLSSKYTVTVYDIEKNIKDAENNLCNLLDELVGDDFDTIGIAGLKKLLGGE